MGEHKTDTRHHNDHYERNGPKQNTDAIYYEHTTAEQALSAPKHQLLFFWFAYQASVGACPVTRNNITRTRKLRQFGSASTAEAVAAAARLVRFWSPDRGSSILNASEANKERLPPSGTCGRRNNVTFTPLFQSVVDLLPLLQIYQRVTW
jgi:hypothetical protein